MDERGAKRGMMAYMHNKYGIYKTGTVLDEAPEHLNEEELLKLANGDGTKKGKNDRRIWWRNRVKRIGASLRPQRPPKGAGQSSATVNKCH